MHLSGRCLIRKLSCSLIAQPLSETWNVPHLPEAQVVKFSHCSCHTLPASHGAGTGCAGVFIIYTQLLTSCFGLLPDLCFSSFLGVADRLSGVRFHRLLVKC